MKSFWATLNNQPVIGSINKLKKNYHNKAASISCFDFWTLCTTTTHVKLMNILFEIIDFSLKGV